jgi:MerR family transcriptional regulator/heat shock protein HspR
MTWMSGRSDERGIYVISVAAELAGVHPQTLRSYERAGLLEPARTGGGTRLYSDRDLGRLARIQELTTTGLSLAGVKRILALEEEVRALRNELERYRARGHARAVDDCSDRSDSPCGH